MKSLFIILKYFWGSKLTKFPCFDCTTILGAIESWNHGFIGSILVHMHPASMTVIGGGPFSIPNCGRSLGVSSSRRTISIYSNRETVTSFEVGNWSIETYWIFFDGMEYSLTEIKVCYLSSPFFCRHELDSTWIRTCSRQLTTQV